MARMMRGMIPMRYILILVFLVIVLSLPINGHALQTITLESITAKALANAYEQKLSAIDIGISRANLKIARSQYYPVLTGRWNSEYNKDLTNGTEQINAVGNTVVVRNTMFQNMGSVSATYNLFDFGNTQKRVSIAKYDVEAKKANHTLSLRDIKLKVLSLYADLVVVSRELEFNREIMALNKEIADLQRRLYRAGRVTQIEVVDKEVRTKKSQEAVDTLLLKKKSTLQDIGYYTGDVYNSDELTVEGLAGVDEEYTATFDTGSTPEATIYNLEIAKKKAELDILRNDWLPQFGLYANYIWYGNNKTRLGESVDNVRPRSYTVGVGASMALFEGFKNNADMDRTRLELERLKVEKAKKMAELRNRYGKLDEAQRTYIQNLRRQKEMLLQVEEKLSMTVKLSERMIVERIDLLTQKIELLNQKYELTRAITANASTIRELQILAGTKH